MKKIKKILFIIVKEVYGKMKYVACIGNFDGVHLGHQKLIKKVLETAGNEFIPAVITLDPDPKTIYTNDKRRKHLTTLSQKEEIMYSLGIQEVILINFTKEVSYVTPDIFIEYFLNEFDLDTLICGPDYSFAHKGAGKVDTLLRSKIKNFKVEVVEDELFEGKKINSTDIISLIKKGDINTANHLLGRDYHATVIVKDKKIIDTENILPDKGEYKVVVDDKNHILKDRNISIKNGQADIYFPTV